MPKVVIVGNSGAARECYWVLRDLLESAPGLANYYQFAGFFSWGGYPDNLKELAQLGRGSIEMHDISREEVYVIGAGKPELRKDIYNYLKDRDAALMNLIHPWASICSSAQIGEGNIFQRGSTVYANACVGNGNFLNGAVNISHDASIGDFNFLAPYSIVLGGASIGDLNHLAPHAVIMDRAHMGSRNSLSPGSALFRGCGDSARLSGNPALKTGELNGD